MISLIFCQHALRGRFQSLTVRAALLLCILSFIGHAEKYALLIGINRYTPAAGVQNLEGPVNDANALRQVLVSNWQFRSENIKTLFDSEATKSRILNALDEYASSLKPGDFLFLFYSGHGTSWFAPGKPQTGVASDTGAIVSADLQLIVGDMDLQPRLRKLDDVAQVFAVFDSCYSGNSIKSLAIAPPRYLPPELFRSVPNASMAQYDRQFSDFDRFTSASSKYPYRRILYLSAASKAEQAVDIPKLLILHGFRTVDGMPHGALTDAVLRGLRGDADTNHDGTITYEELFEFARKTVSGEFPQTPQFLVPPSDPQMADTPVFSVANALTAKPSEVTSVPTVVRVKLENGGDPLRTRIASITGVSISDDLFDLLIRRDDSGLELYDQSGTLIQKYAVTDEASLVRRIRAEPEVRKLVDVTYTKQDFNVTLSIIPDGNGFYRLRDRLRFRAKTEQDCYFLLLDVDVSGMVTIVFPLSKGHLARVPSGGEAFLGGESQVSRPTGTEYLKLFGFHEKPPGLDDLIGEAKDPIAPGTQAFEKLMGIVKSDTPGRATTRVKLVTTE